MVSISIIQSSNSLISSTLPAGLVAVFVGATSGIGETSLKQFAKHAKQPRVYFIGRSQDAANRIAAECKVLNSGGEYMFIKADVSLVRNVDKVCTEIREKEKAINILFLSAGIADISRSETSEHLHLLVALTFYSRIRFITNLIPLIQAASSLRRVVFVGGAGYEGHIDASDFQARRIPLTQLRGQLSTMISLGLEAVAETAPGISFVHEFPGTVKTALFDRTTGILGVVMRSFFMLFGRWIGVPIDECGERHLYLATSARYPPATGECLSVPVGTEVEVAQGTSGQIGSGVYSVLWDCENSPPSVIKLLSMYRDKGMMEEIWKHTESEFSRIKG